jgi:hypothetical protein
MYAFQALPAYVRYIELLSMKKASVSHDRLATKQQSL